MTVGILDVVIDFRDQFLHTAKSSPANGLLRDAVELDLYLIDLGNIDRSEVQMESCRAANQRRTRRCLWVA